MMNARITVNGIETVVSFDSRMLLVELLRDVLQLKGTRVGCLNGDCGACTARLDGKLVKTCLFLAASMDGRTVETIEEESVELDALRRAFISEHGFQCGFCTSGMLMTGADLLMKTNQPDEKQIREAISGNLCRCTGYDAIVRSIGSAAKKLGDVGR